MTIKWGHLLPYALGSEKMAARHHGNIGHSGGVIFAILTRFIRLDAVFVTPWQQAHGLNDSSTSLWYFPCTQTYLGGEELLHLNLIYYIG
jgi:hypothetical protein